jgi:hypothetical protein
MCFHGHTCAFKDTVYSLIVYKLSLINVSDGQSCDRQAYGLGYTFSTISHTFSEDSPLPDPEGTDCVIVALYVINQPPH